jgi:hypothetical protein
MVHIDAVNRRFERFIGYDAYNNTEEYQQRIKENRYGLSDESQEVGELIAIIIIDHANQKVEIKRVDGNSIDKKVEENNSK